MPKPKLLWLGDAVAPTGFARVTHNITNRLADKWDVHILGINYPGDPHKYDKVKIYPAGTGGDIFGVGRLADLIKRVQPDMICALQDPWNIVKYLEQWRQLENRPPFVAYMPVDAPHMKPATAKALNQLTAAIFYTHFGLNEARKSGYAGAGHVVPHGVDTDVYQPVKREIARQELGMPKPAWNAFIVGNVNSNNPRKRLDLTIRYFARWVEEYDIPPNVLLYVHCDIRDDRSYDLLDAAKLYGVPNRCFFPNLSNGGWLSEERMKYVYSSLDVQVSTTMGEGFGLTTAEGMACRVPQIPPEYSGLGEWAKGAALLVPCTDHLLNGSAGCNTMMGLVDENEFIVALNRMYRWETLRRKYALAGLDRVRQGRYRWDAIAADFDRLLGQYVPQEARAAG